MFFTVHLEDCTIGLESGVFVHDYLNTVLHLNHNWHLDGVWDGSSTNDAVNVNYTALVHNVIPYRHAAHECLLLNSMELIDVILGL